MKSPAETSIQQGNVVEFLPNRYPAQRTLDDPQTAMARKTDWHDIGEEFYLGAGQKTLSTDIDDYPLLQVRSIVFNSDKIA